MCRKRALFLDRDGVINVDHGYVFQRDKFEFIEGIFDLVKTAKERGYLVVIVTNQAGIARGYYSENQFHDLMNWVCDEFSARGGEIHAVYFCPYHPEHGIGSYKRDSEFRKPKPGMILAAAREHGIDLGKSVLVGDKEADLEAGLAAGVKHNILFRQSGYADTKAWCSYVVRNLNDVVAFLSNEEEPW